MLNLKKQMKRASQEAQRKISVPSMKARSSRTPCARERTMPDWQRGQGRLENGSRTFTLFYRVRLSFG